MLFGKRKIGKWRKKLAALAEDEDWHALEDEANWCLIEHRKSAVGYFYRGLARDGLGAYEDAITDYNTAIEFAPKHAPLYYNRGAAKGALGRYEDAMADQNKATALDPPAPIQTWPGH